MSKNTKIENCLGPQRICDNICGMRQIFQLKIFVGAFCGNKAFNLDGLTGSLGVKWGFGVRSKSKNA